MRNSKCKIELQQTYAHTQYNCSFSYSSSVLLAKQSTHQLVAQMNECVNTDGYKQTSAQRVNREDKRERIEKTGVKDNTLAHQQC